MQSTTSSETPSGTSTTTPAALAKYVSETKAPSWKSTIKSYTLVAADGTKTKVDGAVVPSPIAEDVRALKFASMTVTLG